MDTINFAHDLLEREYKALEAKVARHEAESNSKQKRQAVERLRLDLGKVDELFQDFSITYDCSTSNVKLYFVGKINYFKESIEQLGKRIDAFENPLQHAENQGKQDTVIVEPTQRQVLVAETNQKLDQAEDDLKDIINTLTNAKSITHEIKDELRRQQEKLRGCQDQLDEIYSLTKQTKKTINYFKRAVVTDKLWMVLLVLIIIGIIVVIIMKIAGFKGSKESFSQQVLRIIKPI